MEDSKAALRLSILAKRDQISPLDQAHYSARICAQAQDEIQMLWPDGANILAFVPFRTEVDIFPLLEFFWKNPQFACFLPKIQSKATGVFLPMRTYKREDLQTSDHFGIEEPVGNETVPPQNLDLILVPAVAIDTEGQRLGYGKGFYDRFLSLIRPDCQKWALIFSQQRVEKIPVDPYDIPVDALVDETAFFSFFRSHGL